MKISTKILLALLTPVCFICNGLRAQNTFPSTGAAGIGTTAPNASSLLEIKSTTKGVLISRMTKNQRDIIATPAVGLLIYQTNSTPGFYYYSGTAWTAIASKGWSLTGNAGTIPGTNFIGTTDAQPLVFKINNKNAGLLDYDVLKANTAFGFLSLNTNTGNSNSAFGYKSLFSNTAGNGNLANGAYALYFNNGDFNVANGFKALYNNVGGYANTANGFQTLFNNTGGILNTGTGSEALFSNTTGSYNTAHGYQALFSNTTGADNTAMGLDALHYNTSGLYNTATGRDALRNNATGSFNTATGRSALYTNTGDYNTATGYYALYSNITGVSNTANGLQALYSNINGSHNTANGLSSLYSNTNGNNNSAYGEDALHSSTTGYGNTANGFYSFWSNTTGSQNTALGAFTSLSQGDLTNAMALGYGAYVNASNKVVVGNSDVSVIGGQVGWSNFSDGRFKTNIKNNVPGLVFINKLKPVTYNLELKKFDKFLGKKDSLISSNQAGYAIEEKKLRTGFVAQEVEKAAQEIQYDFDGVNHPQHDKDNYSLVYADFVPSLVKAVQELSSENDELKIKNAELESRLQKIEKLLAGNQQTATVQQTTLNNIDEARLEQNAPNPFNSNTVIRYYVPAKINNAQLVINDATGHLIKAILLTAKGNGQITIAAGSLAAGDYFYSLMIDGKKSETRQMILSK